MPLSNHHSTYQGTLEDALIPGLPPAAYYIPSFITPSEEAHLLAQIDSVPRPQWRTLSHRRLQAHPYPLTASNTLIAGALPQWLSEPIIPRLLSIPVSTSRDSSIFHAAPHSAPNHCLINEYLPGQGILPHEDGDAYFPVVATVSLGAPIVLDIYAKGESRNKAARWRLLQERGSLLVISEELYTEYLHGIREQAADQELQEVVNCEMISAKEDFKMGRFDRQRRISLTFRDVIKVKKLGLGLEKAILTK